MAKINLGTQSHAFCSDTLEGARIRLLNNDFKYVQVSPAKISKEICQDMDFDPESTAKYMKEKLDGLNITAIGCYVNLADDSGEAVGKFFKYIELTHYLGVKYICTETGKAKDPDKTRSEETYQIVLGNVRKIARHAEKYNVIVALEMAAPHSIWNVELFNRLIEETQSQNIGCLPDMAGVLDNTNMCRQREIMDRYFEYFRDKICLFHIKDVTYFDGSKKVTIPGKGEIDFEYLFKKIHESFDEIDMIIDSPTDAFVLETREAVKKYI